jgi:hypothetical protein
VKLDLKPAIKHKLDQIAHECSLPPERLVVMFVEDGILGYFNTTPDEFRSTLNPDEESEVDPQLCERPSA